MRLSYSGAVGSSDNLREKQAEIQATLKSIDGRIERVMMWAHEDEARARNEMQRLLRNHPDGSTIHEILGDDTKRRRPLKQEFLGRKYQIQLPGPLAELSEAFRDRRDALIRAAEVAKAYRDALESEERQLFEERARARQQDGEKPVRQHDQEHRRKRR